PRQVFQAVPVFDSDFTNAGIAERPDRNRVSAVEKRDSGAVWRERHMSCIDSKELASSPADGIKGRQGNLTSSGIVLCQQARHRGQTGTGHLPKTSRQYRLSRTTIGGNAHDFSSAWVSR